MKHKLIKALIWFFGLFVAGAIPTALMLAGVRLGAIPTIILYALVIWICSTACKSYNERYDIDWCDHCGKKAPLTPYQGKLLDNGTYECLHLCDKCLHAYRVAPPADIGAERHRSE